MEIRRIAIIFDTTLRPETAGVYCRRALERLVEVQHFQPYELDRISRNGFELYLNIDDGLRYHLPADCRPSAFWAIDTHLDFDRCREKAPRFDVVFAAQRDGVELLRGAGVSSASWLPLACDPDIHRKHEDVARRYDVAFVGNVFPGPRGDLLGLIQRRYRNSFVGQCYFDEVARTDLAARVAFNRSIRNDVNNRHEEAVVAYRQSLRYRPSFWPTFFNLSYALTDGDRLTEAKAACERRHGWLPTNRGPDVSWRGSRAWPRAVTGSGAEPVGHLGSVSWSL
jgi:hypothetical protein